MTPTSLVGRSDAGPVVTLMLSRPQKRNALNLALLEALHGALKELETAHCPRVVVLKGDGPAFCAGLDLEEAGDPTTAHRSSGLIATVFQQLAEARYVSIAAVHGAAIAGGAGLMSACDLVVAAEGTQIGYPETRRGLVAALAGVFLRRQLRERDARELLLTGETVDAERAREMGLINRVVPADQLDVAVQTLARAVLAGAPGAAAATKHLLGEIYPRPLAADIEHALRSHRERRNSAEVTEGLAAFQAKRPPSWTPPS